MEGTKLVDVREDNCGYGEFLKRKRFFRIQDYHVSVDR